MQISKQIEFYWCLGHITEQFIVLIYTLILFSSTDTICHSTLYDDNSSVRQYDKTYKKLMAGIIHTEILPTLRLLIMCILQYDVSYYNLFMSTIINISVLGHNQKCNSLIIYSYHGIWGLFAVCCLLTFIQKPLIGLMARIACA